MQRIHRRLVLSQHRRAGTVESQLVQHARADFLERIGTVLASARVVVVEDQASNQCDEELVVLEHDLLVGVGDGHGGDAPEVH